MREVEQRVRELLDSDKSGHGFEHVERVRKMAMTLAKKERANLEVVELGALLHDVDDYKLFGMECAKNLTNAREIMNDVGIGREMQGEVLEIVGSMGYSKYLEGVRPRSLEGKIVSDADMLDGIGVVGIIRAFEFDFSKGNGFVFDKNIFPNSSVDAGEYRKQAAGKRNNFITHFFEKLLKLDGLMMTESGRKESAGRQKIMVDFLRQFFVENDAGEWVEYLDNYLEKMTRVVYYWDMTGGGS
ncbi:HD domain-containing protein [Candidatus Saccharibacteria bacterium]|nr:HD domain-containing protein [Candidatus Saccharibacteria bacterium]